MRFKRQVLYAPHIKLLHHKNPNRTFLCSSLSTTVYGLLVRMFLPKLLMRSELVQNQQLVMSRLSRTEVGETAIRCTRARGTPSTTRMGACELALS